MTPGDALGQEMRVLRELTEGDQELASFLQEMRATLVAPPAAAVATALPARLAVEARAAGPSRAPSTNGRGAASERPRRAPWRPVLRVALAVAAIPLLFTGLAFAGVKLPDPATSAFESIGIDLPNQAEDDQAAGGASDDDDAGTAHDGDSAGSETGQSNSSGKLGHGRATQNPARAEGKPGNVRAVGQQAPVPGGGAPADAGGGGGNGGKATGQPESPPAGGPPESAGPPEAQGKSPGGVQENGSSGGSQGAASGGAPLDGKPN